MAILVYYDDMITMAAILFCFLILACCVGVYYAYIRMCIYGVIDVAFHVLKSVCYILPIAPTLSEHGIHSTIVC